MGKRTRKKIVSNVLIERIAAECLDFLRQRGDDISKDATYAQRRRTADWLVRKSPMAPYFMRLGITKGCTLGTSFSEVHDSCFFKAVYYLYAVATYTPGYVQSLGGFSLVFHGEHFRHMYRRLAYDYYALRRQLRTDIDEAEGTCEDTYVPALEEIAGWNGDYTTYRGTWIHRVPAVVYIVGGALHGFISNERFMDDCLALRRRSEYELVHNGHARDLLTLLHNYDVLPLWRNETNVLADSAVPGNGLIEFLFGGTHDMWHAEARVWCEETRRALELMQFYELLDTEYQPEQPIEEQMQEDEEPTGEEEVYTSGAVGMADVPADVMRLANRLAKKHGTVKISNESNGFHIYIADPDLIASGELKELQSMHLSINAERYLGIGRYDIYKERTTENTDLYRRYRMHGKEVPSAMSMKTRKIWMVSDLLSMPPLAQRLAQVSTVAVDTNPNVQVGSMNKRLVYDEYGNLIPEPPGETVPINELPMNHPAVEYLRGRGFTDMDALWDQFETSFCERALPEDRAMDRFYGRMAGGFKKSAEGRIVFNIVMNGVREGWQARLIDKTEHYGPADKYYCYLDGGWVYIRTKCNGMTVQEAYPPDDRHPKGFDPPKYINATGAKRNRLLAGFDAAVEYNATRAPGQRFCVLVEGVLDAARIGPPAIAILGKFLSAEQASRLRKEFKRVFVIPDNDTAGESGLASVIKAMSPTPVLCVRLPQGVKDAGELTNVQAAELVKNEILTKL